MERHEVKELSYITPIENVESIMVHGLLSHTRAARLPHASIAKPGVQDIRAGKTVPRGMLLHDYVNLYLNPRNPMMYLRKDQHPTCSIIRVNPAVLDGQGVVVTDRNASRFAVFRPAPDGLAIVDKELTFARYWTHQDPIEQDRRKALQCAEVLVPHVVPPDRIVGAYVSCQAARMRMLELGFELPIRLAPYLFFQ
jgi:hypothetical protein